MASNGSPQWHWSPEHQRYYWIEYGNQGQVIYHWANNVSVSPPVIQPPQVIPPATHPATPQPATPYGVHVAKRDSAMDPGRLAVPICGTPEKGTHERLDSSYKMRQGREARDFFKKGRVFSMLHSEAASLTESWNGFDNENFTVVRFGEKVYSQIRRFVVVKVKKGFVYACPISTYSGRGTLKSGCIPAEHAIVYFLGSYPVSLEGEHGMTREPIGIQPADPSLRMTPASRIRFGKTYPIEMNVKVKDIGYVHPNDMSKLVKCYKEHNADDDDEEDQPANNHHGKKN